MKRALLFVCALALLPGCSSSAPESNQAPEATISSISPADVTEGETVTFVGQGTDADGEVVGYFWSSELEGELSRSATFETDLLAVGEHAIEFTVQDNNGAWSAEVRGSVTVLDATFAPATVGAFGASPSTIEPGESTTLSWDIFNATSVSLDQDIGTVEASGSLEVTPDTTTTYRLTATGGGATVTANVTVSVEQPVNRVTLAADEELSGYIRSSGVERNIGIYVGDDDANRDIQGFLTFDIRDIPDDATITRVIVDLSAYDTPHDLPYPGLGCLRAYVHEYSALRDQYWWQELTEPIAEWCDFDALDMPEGSIGLRDALQEGLDESRFQFRLQFTDPRSDWDDTRDLLHWERGNLPTMIVEYSSDDL